MAGPEREEVTEDSVMIEKKKKRVDWAEKERKTGGLSRKFRRTGQKFPADWAEMAD